MVDFYLFTNEQSLVDQLENFELHFDLIESSSQLASLAQDTIIFLDLTNDSISLAEVHKQCLKSQKIVVIVDGMPKREIKRLIENFTNVFSFLTFPLHKNEVEDVILELRSFIDSHKKNKSHENVKSSKFDLEFSVLDSDNSTENESNGDALDKKEELNSAEKKALSKKLGMFNFFEEKEFDQSSELNQRIQFKFNHVYGPPETRTRSNLFVSKSLKKDGASLELPTEEIDELDNIKEVFTSQDDDMATKNKKGLEFNLPKLEFEDAPAAPKEEVQQKANLDFDLEFGNEEEGAMDDSLIESKLNESKSEQVEQAGVGIDFSNDLDLEIENAQSNPDATSKTIVFDRSSLNNVKTSNNTSAAGGLNFDSLDEEDEDLFGLQQNNTSESLPADLPNDGIELSGLDSSQIGFSIESKVSASDNQSSSVEQSGLGLSLSDDGDEGFELELGSSASKKSTTSTESTGSLDPETKDIAEGLEFKTDSNSIGSNSTADYMSTAEARANIESTINDIVRPQLGDKTEEIDVGLNLTADEATVLADADLFKNDVDDFSREFKYKQKDHSLSFTAKKDAEKNIQDISFGNGLKLDSDDLNMSESSLPGFDISSSEIEAASLLAQAPQPKSKDALVFKNLEREEERPNDTRNYRSSLDTDQLLQEHRKNDKSEFVGGHYADEDFVRAQATIRQLREERDELLLEIKQLKRETKELEQENLSLRAENDELRIEQSISRKRHMAEVEDLKYHLQLSDEKRLTAEEKLRQSEKNREKLEQNLRLDFSQVRQREKELENQLELLSIDHDAQIQTRDTKILDLRRKIESLEFNMENASIREQRTNEDKKKLEEKLVKIMKTLRHSIENIDDERFSVNNDGENE